MASSALEWVIVANAEVRRKFWDLARLLGICFKRELVSDEPVWGPRLCRSHRGGIATLKHFLQVHLQKIVCLSKGMNWWELTFQRNLCHSFFSQSVVTKGNSSSSLYTAKCKSWIQMFLFCGCKPPGMKFGGWEMDFHSWSHWVLEESHLLVHRLPMSGEFFFFFFKSWETTSWETGEYGGGLVSISLSPLRHCWNCFFSSCGDLAQLSPPKTLGERQVHGTKKSTLAGARLELSSRIERWWQR